MKLWVFTIFYLCSVWGVYAAEIQPVPNGMMIQGKFEEERDTPGFKTPLVSNGSFILVPGRGLIWAVEHPFVIQTHVTPNGIVQKIDGAETSRLEAQKIPHLSHLSDMMMGAMSGDLSLVGHFFDIQVKETSKGSDFTLVAKGSDAKNFPFQKIQITYTKFVDLIILSYPDGGTHTIRFKNQSFVAIPNDFVISPERDPS